MNEKLRAVATILKEFSLQGSAIDLEQVPLFQRIAAKNGRG